jgi:hypothetical protein
MSNQGLIVADIARLAAVVLFVTMTMMFLTLPYALSFHPGEESLRTAATPIHLT